MALPDVRTIRHNLGYVRPEKQTLGGQCGPAATAANTAAMTADNAGQVWTTVECPPSAQTATDRSGSLAHSYGSDALRGKCVLAGTDQLAVCKADDRSSKWAFVGHGPEKARSDRASAG
jgi:hypothetical protein